MDLARPGVVPEEILDRRLVKKGNAAHLQVLIKCSSIAADSATWEDYNNLKLRYPQAPAWGPASSQGEEPVRAATLTVIASQ